MKICTKCGESKELTEFSKRNRNNGSLQPKCKVCVKEYYQANKEAITVKVAEYYQTPKGKAVSKNSAHKRRVVIKDGCVSTEELQQLIEDNTECFYCGCDITDVNRHIDHFIPISKGGLHDLQNLVVACATCNLKKSDKMPEEFMA